MLYDILLGYGTDHHINSPEDSGNDGTSGDSESNNGVQPKGGKSPTLTMTTCYSPVSSSVQSGGGNRGGSTNPNETSIGSSSSSSNFFDSKYFPPYSIILAITIAVGKLKEGIKNNWNQVVVEDAQGNNSFL
jgi:hypothetical protein